MSANGTPFCVDCPDREACSQGMACETVRLHAVDGEKDETERMVQSLTDWWLDHANAEVVAMAPKAVEYGANSMIEVGRTMARIQGRHNISDEEATEMACMFYIAGKIGRWVDAVTAGKRPSTDTIYDIGIYAKMAQRIRDVGGWPFGTDEESN